MTVKINADTTNGAVITSDTSGEIELQAGGTKIATVKSTGLEYLAHSTVLYLDGVDDYVEGYINITGATNATVAPVAQASALSGYLVSI